jgi:hypothetical protein
MTMTINEVIIAITKLRADAEQVVAALTAHMRNEPDHAKRGSLARLQIICHELDLHVREGLEQYKQVTVGTVADELRQALSDATPTGPSRAALDRIIAFAKT